MTTNYVTKPRVRVKAGSGELTVKGEGDVRPGPWFLPVTGGWLPADVGDSLNWWQQGGNVQGMSRSAMVEACVSAYSQTVAMCPGDHWRLHDDGGRTRVKNSALVKVLKRPNSYQTISDFLLNLTRSLYMEGNAYALAIRNNRYEITELHLMNPRGSTAMPVETGEVFYNLSGNNVLNMLYDYPMMVPARDVLHVKLNTSPWNPLRGESPIIAAARDIAAGDAMAQQQLAFYMNQARPSTVLTTDMVLDKDQAEALRARWNEQSRGLAAGGTPILTAGLKPVPLSISPLDAQLAEIMKMSEQRIALAFRVPLQILGIGAGAGFGSTEALMQYWAATSLGFCLNHVEEAFGKLFGLAGVPDEYLELNTAALLRSAEKDRIESLVRAVQGGIRSPDEARESEGFPKVPGGFGDEPRVQQQVVPLSAWAAAIPATPAPPAPAASDTVPLKDDSNYVIEAVDEFFESAFERKYSTG